MPPFDLDPFDLEKTCGLWNACAALPAPLGPRYTLAEQLVREAAYDEGMTSVEHAATRAHAIAATRAHAIAATRAQTIAAFGRFSATALNLSGEATGLLTNEFLPVGTDLISWARQFDPSLSMPDIIQACRNAWTACGMQPLLGLPVRLTPAIFGYSMLYPYSDNFLDEHGVSAEEKIHFSRRFRLRLQGEMLATRNEREAALWALVGLIETQYPRELYGQVFDALLAIHRAQEDSIRQLGGNADLLRVSCAKGGTSVLADAVLARPDLSFEEKAFAFEWGVLLQLGDDLQDVREDLRRGSRTLFSTAVLRGERLDALALQLLNFGEAVGRRMDALPHGSEVLKSLLKMSWRQLIVRAISDSYEFFSDEFLRESETWSPFRFEFLRSRQARVASAGGLYSRIFEAFLEDSEPEVEGLSYLSLT
jgi:hypothetical protein